MTSYNIRKPFVAGIVFCAMFVIVLLSACGSSTKSSVDARLAACRQTYKKASEAQRAGDFATARRLFGQCVNANSDKAEVCDSMLPIVNNAVTQILNIYQAEGDPMGCVAYLRRLKRQRSGIVGRMCRRDVAVCLAYAMSRTEDVDGAAAEMDAALKIAPVEPSGDRLFRDYAYASAVYFCLPERRSDVVKYGSMAMNQLKYCSNKSGGIWVGSILGIVYKRRGELRNAINMFKQCYDNARESRDSLGMANSCYLVADMLMYWNLATYANEYATRGADIVTRMHGANPMVCANVLTNKAVVMSQLGRSDSAFYYLDLSKKYVRDLPYNSGNSDIDLLRGSLLVSRPSERTAGITLLEKVASEATMGIRARAYFELAKARFADGSVAAGEAALDSTLTLMGRYTSPIAVNAAYEYALHHYSTTGNNAKILMVAKEMNRLYGDYSNSTMIRQIAENVTQFRLEQREESMRLEKIQMDNQKLLVKWSFIVALLVLICVTGMFFVKRRYDRIERKFAKQQLESLTSKLEALALEKEQLSRQLHSSDGAQQTAAVRAASSTEGQTSAVAVPMRDMATLRREREQLIGYGETRINDKECEDRFRNTFSQLHPAFIDTLRHDIPGISRREELLAMLISLRLDNGQIENIMCIARSSVNMARYRLRSKMQLERGQSLDDAIMKLLDKE